MQRATNIASIGAAPARHRAARGRALTSTVLASTALAGLASFAAPAGAALAAEPPTAARPGDFAGRYMTNRATLMTFAEVGGGLNGQSQTVGPGAAAAESLQLTPETSRHEFVGDVYRWSNGQKRESGRLTLSDRSTRPFEGRWTSGAWAGRPFIACPVADNEHPAQDAALRGGTVVWSKLLKAEIQATPVGHRLLVQVQVWGVDGAVRAAPALADASGGRLTAMSFTNGYGGPTMETPIIPTCASATINFAYEGDLSRVAEILPPSAPDGAAGWDISALVAGAQARVYRASDSDRAALQATKIPWRTADGIDLTSLSTSSDQLLLTGRDGATGTDVRLDARFAAPGRLVGRWQERRGGDLVYSGDFELAPPLAGAGFAAEAFSRQQVRRSLRGCPRDSGAWTGAVASDGLWIGQDRAVRTSDGKGVRLSLQVQNFGAADRAFDPAKLRLSLLRRDGASAIGRDASASATPLKPCEARTLQVVFSDVAFDVDRLEARLDGGPPISWPVSLPFRTAPVEPGGHYQPSASEVAALAALKGGWRTSHGFEQALELWEGGIRGLGPQPAPSSTMLEFRADIVAPGRLSGSWFVNTPGAPSQGGAATLLLQGGGLAGEFIDAAKVGAPVFFCRPGDRPARSKFLGQGLWIRHVAMARDTAGGAVVKLELQNVLPTAKAWRLARLGFQVRSSAGAAVATSALQSVDAVGGELTLQPCQIVTLPVRAPDAVGFDITFVDLLLDDQKVAEWVTPLARGLGAEPPSDPPSPPPPSPAPPAPSPATIPSPAPLPAPAPAPSPGPSPNPPPRPGPMGGGAPAALAAYSNYGIWDFKVLEFGRDADGDWQAVVSVRDAASYRIGLGHGGVIMVLYDEDGRGVQSDETLYRASVRGTGPQLEKLSSETMWMEKGDEVRVRLFFRRSKTLNPVRVRLMSGDRGTLSRTFDLP